VRILLKDLRRLASELAIVHRTLKKDRQMLKRLDSSLEKNYQFLFHAGYQSLKLYRFSHAFYVSGFKFLAYLLYHINRILHAVDIHPAAVIEPGVVIDHGAGVVIGSTAYIGEGTIIYHGVTLGARRFSSGKRHPTIGRNVILGAGAKVLGPIHVGDGARVGANAVVLEDVPPNATVVGIPAEVRRNSNQQTESIKIFTDICHS